MKVADKNIRVYDVDGRPLANCTRKRANFLTSIERARWIGHCKIQLSVNNKERKEIKDKVIAQANGVCYICGEKTDIPTIDHVIPKKARGQDRDWNLQCCCKRCNEDKADLEIKDYVRLIYLNRKSYPYLSNEQLVKLECFMDDFYKSTPYEQWRASKDALKRRKPKGEAYVK